MCYMFELNLPNIMKDECNAKQKHSFEFVLPSRLLYLPNIAIYFYIMWLL